LTGFAVAGGESGDRRECLIIAVLLEPVDGVVAGVVSGEDLREEEAQRDPWCIDTFTPLMIAMTANGLHERPREDREERELTPLPLELVSLKYKLVARR
jgi:hypothetical protein